MLIINTKYKLTDQTKIFDGHTLYRIQALSDFGDVKKGELGGWIETEDNLSQWDRAWVRDNAYVYGNARISDDAQIYDNARISDHAYICDNARVYGDACVFGHAHIYRNAKIFGNAKVFDNALISDCVQVSGNTRVFGDARIDGNLKITGGEFYHTQDDLIEVKKIKNNNGLVTLCSNPKFADEELNGKKVKIKLAEGTIIEGELIED